MATCRTLVVCCLLLSVLATCGTGTIHRAKNAKKSSASGRGPLPLHNPDHNPDPKTEEKPMIGGHFRETWVYATISAMLVGLSGIFPLAVIPMEAGKALRKGAAGQRLKLLLSFAVGGLLGDVFLHLLPEAWQHISPDDHVAQRNLGLWVLAGLFSFLLVEKIFPDGDDDDEDEEEGEEEIIKDHTLEYTSIVANDRGKSQNKLKHTKGKNKKGHGKKSPKKEEVIMNGHSSPKKTHSKKNGLVNGTIPNGTESHRHHHANGVSQMNGHAGKNRCLMSNGHANSKLVEQSEPESQHIKTSGWLNLLANVIDNFTHGLAVAGSYCVSTKSGVITTIIILLHEIPHEVGDFAILLRSGFDRWKAAKCQLLTATGGILGAITALAAESAQEAGNRTAWILPFTSGGFIYVALVTVVPDLLKETNAWESLKQVIFLLMGLFSMAAVAMWLDEHDLPTMEWLDSSFQWLQT